MLRTGHLTILQYNARKSRRGVMMPLFEDQRVQNIDILAIKEPRRNPAQATTYHPLKRVFEFVFEDRSNNTRVVNIINEAMNISTPMQQLSVRQSLDLMKSAKRHRCELVGLKRRTWIKNPPAVLGFPPVINPHLRHWNRMNLSKKIWYIFHQYTKKVG